RLLEPGSPLRLEAIDRVAKVTGLSTAMTTLVLEGMAAEWREERLLDLLRSEFNDPDVLDRFSRRAAGSSVRALGPALTLHIFSGNVPGVSVTSLVRALLVKSASLAKTASSEPVLAPLFARALAEEDEGLGECLAVT